MLSSIVARVLAGVSAGVLPVCVFHQIDQNCLNIHLSAKQEVDHFISYCTMIFILCLYI
jgi:hypothetical protein